MLKARRGVSYAVACSLGFVLWAAGTVFWLSHAGEDPVSPLLRRWLGAIDPLLLAYCEWSARPELCFGLAFDGSPLGWLEAVWLGFALGAPGALIAGGWVARRGAATKPAT